MDTELITRLNNLWEPVYPYLERWMESWAPKDNGWILETGPFSGGIITAMLERFPTAQGMIALSERYVAQAIKTSFALPCPVLVSHLDRLPLFPVFDLVICRGAFFFLTPQIIQECYRVLRPGGYAILGGGYGPDTPEEVISLIAEESKDLNYRLGKKWISRTELEKMVAETNLESQSSILVKGGLWLLIGKES